MRVLRYADGTFTLESAFFDHRYEDLIQFVHTSQATSRPVNIGKARVYGFEMTAQRRFGSRVDLSGNYTYQKATDKSNIPHLNGNILPNRPPHALFVRATMRLGRCTVFYDYTFEDGNFLDRANRRLTTIAACSQYGRESGYEPLGFYIGLEVKNLTGAQIADTWGYPLPGRTFFLSVNAD